MFWGLCTFLRDKIYKILYMLWMWSGWITSSISSTFQLTSIKTTYVHNEKLLVMYHINHSQKVTSFGCFAGVVCLAVWWKGRYFICYSNLCILFICYSNRINVVVTYVLCKIAIKFTFKNVWFWKTFSTDVNFGVSTICLNNLWLDFSFFKEWKERMERFNFFSFFRCVKFYSVTEQYFWNLVFSNLYGRFQYFEIKNVFTYSLQTQISNLI